MMKRPAPPAFLRPGGEAPRREADDIAAGLLMNRKRLL
jgi:hypothetical protein